MEHLVHHVNLPHFSLSLSRALDPRSLSGRPLALSLPSPRATLLDVSSEAFLAGCRRGMPLSLAQKLCPDLHILPPDPDLADRATRALLKTLLQFSPLCEPAGPGHFFLDLSGTERLWGAPLDAATRIRETLGRTLRLWPATAAASNKLVSHVATRVVKPDGIESVPHGTEAAYLAPLGIRMLPGLGEETARRLEELNVRRAGELAALPAPALAAAFGPAGPAMRDRARGIDPTPVRADPGARDVVELATLADDTNDAEILADVASRLVQAAARRLRSDGIRARHIELALTHSDGIRASRASSLPSPADLDPDLIPEALSLLEAALRRRVRVRSLRVTLSRLGGADAQATLFGEAPDAKRKHGLVEAVDRIRAKFGAGAIAYRRLSLRGAALGGRPE